ncbi:MAG: tetratricopeptide repeat protein [Bacteroidetes bacterium]|nr:tetratricopeptide repeat protein [Bacteroidota bacterium]
MEHKEKENSGLEIDKTIIETTGKVEAFYEHNKKNVNIAIVAILAVVGGYFAFKMWYIEPKEKEAQTAVFNAQIWFEKDSFNLALNGQGDKQGFLAIIDDYGMTKTANLAHYYAGICYLKNGDFANAISHLEDFNTSNVLVGPLAEGALGDAYVESGDLDKGVKHYTKAANMTKSKLTAPLYLKKAGLVYEDQKQFGNALDVYEKIKTDYADANEAQDIDKYIARAKTAKENN